MKMAQEKLDVIAKPVAQAEIEAWLNFKKVGNKKRTDNQGNIDTLVDAMTGGFLVLDSESKTFTHKLKFPLGEKEDVLSLTYKPRCSYRDARPYLEDVKSTDFDERIVGYFAALTGSHKAYYRAMDSEDMDIARAIVIFFL